MGTNTRPSQVLIIRHGEKVGDICRYKVPRARPLCLRCSLQRSRSEAVSFPV